MTHQNVILTIEEVVLSAITFLPDKYDEIADSIKYSDFMSDFNACMFKAFGTLRAENKAITPELLCVEMNKSMKVSLDDVVLATSHTPVADLESYVAQIKNASINRALVRLATLISTKSTKEGTQAKDTLAEVEKQVYELSMQGYKSDFKNIEEVMKSTLELIKANAARGVLKGLDTGFSELNIATTGFNPGELVVIGARPSMGKTALILSIALRMLARGDGIALFSLEMPSEQLMLRMLSARSQIPLQDLRTGGLNDMQLTQLTKTSNDLCQKANLYIDDSPNLTLEGLRSKIRKLSTQDNSVKAVMIDYLQLMIGANDNNTIARHEVIAQISRGLKNLAREVKMPIIALSQLNRTLEGREDKRPILSDLRESGAIEQDADIILFLYRDEVYKERESKQKAKKQEKEGVAKDKIEIYKAPETEDVELILAKNRNGETKTISIEFKKKYTLFQDKGEDRDAMMAMASAPTSFEVDSLESSIDTSGVPF